MLLTSKPLGSTQSTAGECIAIAYLVINLYALAHTNEHGSMLTNDIATPYGLDAYLLITSLTNHPVTREHAISLNVSTKRLSNGIGK